MRNIVVLTSLVWLACPCVANGQSFELHVSAGPTITDTGSSLAAGAGFSPASRLTIVFDVERTHLSSRTSRDGGVVSSFRGGTLLLGTIGLRVEPFGRNRFGPFGVAGVAAGVSRPNVNAMFPDRVTNRVGAVFVGGGVHVPFSTGMALFLEARMMVGAEGNEGIVAVAPARAGIALRF